MESACLNGLGEPSVERIVVTLKDRLEDVLLDAMNVDGDVVSRED